MRKLPHYELPTYETREGQPQRCHDSSRFQKFPNGMATQTASEVSRGRWQGGADFVAGAAFCSHARSSAYFVGR